MPLLPVYANGRTRLLTVEVGENVREDWLATQEAERVAGIARRRLYYAGEQYQDENRDAADALGIDWLTGRLPEHLRKHAYSTQIAESVDFLADQMAKTFEVEAKSPAVQEVIDALLERVKNPAELLREALVGGDVPVLVVWDEVDDVPRPLFYESEQVRFDYDPDDREVLQRVVMDEVVWVQAPEGEKQAVRRSEWRFEGEQVVKSVQFDDDPPVVVPLTVAGLPWSLLRASTKSMSATRGESVITQQAMETADRYNAVEQVAWLVARYNSHGNLAVIGDAANLQTRAEDRLEKDVADVLTFPGGTAVTTITLPTDPQMIEHQKEVLLEALYGVFGLTRIDQDTVTSYGNLSGYALEILNRKTDGTFDRLRKQWTEDWKTFIGVVLDVVSDRKGAAFPDREMDVRLGGLYIVDDQHIRDDFTAGLISRREALRQRGMSDEDIDRIEDEIAGEKPKTETGTFGTLAQLTDVGGLVAEAAAKPMSEEQAAQEAADKAKADKIVADAEKAGVKVEVKSTTTPAGAVKKVTK